MVSYPYNGQNNSHLTRMLQGSAHYPARYWTQGYTHWLIGSLPWDVWNREYPRPWDRLWMEQTKIIGGTCILLWESGNTHKLRTSQFSKIHFPPLPIQTTPGTVHLPARWLHIFSGALDSKDRVWWYTG